MKFNWKIAVVLVLIVATIGLAISSISSLTYSGKNLAFEVGSGAVTITNPSDAAIPAQFLGSGFRSFAVESTSDVSGTSTREGNGNSATQTFLFDLPIGDSEYTITRGESVSFLATTDTLLKATVLPISSTQTNTTLIALAVFILGALYYISQASGHPWLRFFGSPDKELVDAPINTGIDLGQGTSLKSFGDNRK